MRILASCTLLQLWSCFPNNLRTDGIRMVSINKVGVCSSLCETLDQSGSSRVSRRCGGSKAYVISRPLKVRKEWLREVLVKREHLVDLGASQYAIIWYALVGNGGI